VKLSGAPPTSYFDFWALKFQTPMNGSLGAGGVTVAALRGVEVGTDFAGREALCAAATNPDDTTNVAIRSIKARRELRIGRLPPWARNMTQERDLAK